MKIKRFSTLYENNKNLFEGTTGKKTAEVMYNIINKGLLQQKPEMEKLKQYILTHVKNNTYAKNQSSYSFFEGLIVAYNMMVKSHEQIKEIPKPDVWIDDINAKVADMDTIKKVEK